MAESCLHEGEASYRSTLPSESIRSRTSGSADQLEERREEIASSGDESNKEMELSQLSYEASKKSANRMSYESSQQSYESTDQHSHYPDVPGSYSATFISIS
jgi:hypothetical protein